MLSSVLERLVAVCVLSVEVEVELELFAEREFSRGVVLVALAIPLEKS